MCKQFCKPSPWVHLSPLESVPASAVKSVLYSHNMNTLQVQYFRVLNVVFRTYEYWLSAETLERLSMTFTANGKN